MKELDSIKSNVNGELPNGAYTKVEVNNLDNPKEKLSVAQSIIQVFLENKSLNYKSEKWFELMPNGVKNFFEKLDDNDYKYDELLSTLEICIHSLQNHKEWKWFSSKVNQNSIEIVFEGCLHSHFLWIFHCQGVPWSSFYVEDTRWGNYEISTIRDVTVHKNFH